MKYDIVDLKLLLAISEIQNVSAAAATCYLSPSSASLRLRNLEDVFGTLLFERHARGVSATTAGLVAIEHARGCLKLLNRMHEDLAGYGSGHKIQLKILTCTSAVPLLADDLQPFLQAHPAARVVLDEQHNNEIVSAIAAQKGDIGIVAHDSSHPDLEFFDYRAEELVVVSHGQWPESGEGVSFAKCLDYSMITLAASSPLQRYIGGHAELLGRRVDASVQVPTISALLKLVRAGAGIAILPRAALDTASLSGLRCVSLQEPWAKRSLRVCVRRGSPSASRAASALCLHLAELAIRSRASN